MVSLICGTFKKDTDELAYKRENRLTGIEGKLVFTKVERTGKDKLGVWGLTDAHYHI